MTPPESHERTGLHPRNLHRQRYDFEELAQACPELVPCLKPGPTGEPTLDFADPLAVKTLNRALLMVYYGIQHWDIPPGYLCPPVPGRADYLHHVADLLALTSGGSVPTGQQVRVLDIGVGANCIFPIIGRHVYGWRFVGADIDQRSVTTAQHIVKFNPSLAGKVEIRLQRSPGSIFDGIWKPGEWYHLTVCNPPFHRSKADADSKTERKLRNLGRAGDGPLTRNFGGQKAELYVEGGELAFVKRMVSQSMAYGKECLWFTSVVSLAENLNPLHQALKAAQVVQVKTLESRQGQKQSRILCWSFLTPVQQQAWVKAR